PPFHGLGAHRKPRPYRCIPASPNQRKTLIPVPANYNHLPKAAGTHVAPAPGTQGNAAHNTYRNAPHTCYLKNAHILRHEAENKCKQTGVQTPAYTTEATIPAPSSLLNSASSYYSPFSIRPVQCEPSLSGSHWFSVHRHKPPGTSL